MVANANVRIAVSQKGYMQGSKQTGGSASIKWNNSNLGD
jgi:hypothetical protein